jgi:PAS domain S-box-containing protein
MAHVSDNGLAATFTYDVASDRWEWSRSLQELHGLDAVEQPTTQHLLDSMLEEDRQLALERFQHHLSRPGPGTWVYRMVDREGRIRTLRFVGNALGRDGQVQVLRGFVMDVSNDVTAWQATAVQAAVEHRSAIDQAKGALMLAFHIDEDEAFGMLRNFSNQHNVKLRVVADAIVAGLSDPQYAEPDPVDVLLEIVAAVGKQDSASSADV